MADFGEYTPMNARTDYEGRWWGENHAEMLHQTFPENWAMLNREAVEEAEKLGEIMYWMRSGGRRSKEFQVILTFF